MTNALFGYLRAAVTRRVQWIHKLAAGETG
jgi:hypothetical protein